MKLTINGAGREVPAGSSVGDVVATLVPGGARGVAVAVNAAVVPRGQWSTVELRDGDAVEVLTAVQGG